MEEENGGYYSIIPAEVRFDKNLSPNAKLLYGDISGLCNKQRYCWASNAWLGERSDCDARSISRWVSELEAAGHIIVQIEEMHRRKIFLSKGYDNSVVGVRQNVLHSIKSSIKENTPVSVEIGISPSQSPENEEDTEEEDEDTTVVACDDEGNPLTYNGLGRQKGTPKKDSAYKDREEMIKVVEKTFNKRFLARPKQHSAIKTMLAMGVTTSEITEAIYKIVEKPFYKENGWDFSSVLSEISKK